MEYLTNEKLLKQQQSALFSISNSRSNSVSRFPIPSQRAAPDPVQPLRSADLFNKLEDILKQNIHINHTTTRKRQKQISCILNSQACHEDKKQQNIEASYYKSPIRLLDVQPCYIAYKLYLQMASLIIILKSETGEKLYLLDHLPLTNKIKAAKREILFKINFKKIQIKKKKRALKGLKLSLTICKKKLEEETMYIIHFSYQSVLYEEQDIIKRNQMKEKKVDLNISTSKENNTTLNKLNHQLQIQNNHLQEQLIFEQNQNTKLNMLINNLNDQIAGLHKQMTQQQQQNNEDCIIKDNFIKQFHSKIEQLENEIKQKDQLINNLQQQISEFNNVYKEMQELENLCSSMSFLGKLCIGHNHLIQEIKDLLQVQQNIIEKVTNNKDFPIDQLIIQKRQKKHNPQSQVDYQQLCQETTSILENIIKQIKSSIEQLTERFIHDLLI